MLATEFSIDIKAYKRSSLFPNFLSVVKEDNLYE
jgi:hypothetical protein